jgi:hypothetical protein
MRISIDLASVQDTSRVLAAAADEYDRTAAALQAGDGLGGVTGSQRYWLFSAVESVAARVRAVAAQHRETAADLLRRCECVADDVSPAYAGIAVAGAPIALDRNGDGINDTFAVDGDGDGFFESFVLDTEQDGIYDTVLISDLSGTLQAAFVAPPATVQPGALLGQSFVGNEFGTGFSSYGTAANTAPFGDGGTYWTGQMGYISSPDLSGMIGGTFVGGTTNPSAGSLGGLFGSSSLGTGSTRSPFLNSSSDSRDYGKLPSYQEWSNSSKIDTDGDGVNNRWDNEFRNRDRG